MFKIDVIRLKKNSLLIPCIEAVLACAQSTCERRQNVSVSDCACVDERIVLYLMLTDLSSILGIITPNIIYRHDVVDCVISS